MINLDYCKQELAAYNNEQLSLLEQSMCAWHAAAKPEVRQKLEEQISHSSQQLSLLLCFSRQSRHVPEAEELRKACILLLESGNKLDDEEYSRLLIAFFKALSRLYQHELPGSD